MFSTHARISFLLLEAKSLKHLINARGLAPQFYSTVFSGTGHRNSSSSATSHPTHLAVEQRVVVPPHLRVNVVEVPPEALTLQALPQRYPLGDVSVIDTVVLQGQRDSLGRGRLRFARGSRGWFMVTILIKSKNTASPALNHNYSLAAVSLWLTLAH